MDYMEHVKVLRADAQVHYNCCQAVLVAFAREMGLSEEQAYTLGSHFGSGMLHGATCGALSGALMVLGSLGYDSRQAGAMIRQFRENHAATDCAFLLKSSRERGEAKKDHCDGLVYEMVAELEALLPRE